MDRKEEFSQESSFCNEDFEAIENCPCEDEEPPRQNFLTSMPIYNKFWEPIILYKEKRKKNRLNSFRCPTHTRILHHTGQPTPLHRVNVPKRYARYLRDVSNTLVHGRWRWVILVLILCYSSLWVLFGWLWMLISYAHGDLLEGQDLEGASIGAVTGWRNESCTVGVRGFAGFLLMSIETQTTIGYGTRFPTGNCPEGVFILCLQMILGIGVEGAVLGMIYVKMTRPRLRDCRQIFTKIAVVCQRDGVFCLMFRISDKDHLHMVGTVLKAWLTETRKSEGGKFLEVFQKPLKLENIGLLLWPVTVVHKIDKSSPLYDYSARDLLLKKFEIIITLIGTSDSTGQLTQSRTSYLPSEIHWGHRFRSCVSYDEKIQSYIVNQDLFNATDPIDTPLCSAHRLDEVLGELTEADLEEIDFQTSGIGTMTCSSPISGVFRSSPPNGYIFNSLNGHSSDSPSNGVSIQIPFEEYSCEVNVHCSDDFDDGLNLRSNHENGSKLNGLQRTKKGLNSLESNPKMRLVRLEEILETDV